jgi:glucose/arabinose dehydrogenase
MHLQRATASAGLLVAGLTASLVAGAADYRIETIAGDLQNPWSLAFLPDGTMLVTERAGRLRVIRDGVLVPAPVAGVPEAYVAAQGGLLEVMPDPGFADNQLIYLTLAHGSRQENATRLVRGRFDGSALSDVQVLFTARPSKNTPLHYGGRLAFLPDGTLVLGLGEGATLREEAQKLSSHLGTIVRLNADGTGRQPLPGAERRPARDLELRSP